MWSSQSSNNELCLGNFFFMANSQGRKLLCTRGLWWSFSGLLDIFLSTKKNKHVFPLQFTLHCVLRLGAWLHAARWVVERMPLVHHSRESFSLDDILGGFQSIEPCCSSASLRMVSLSTPPPHPETLLCKCGVDWILCSLSCAAVANSLWPHGLQHARLPCPLPPPRACSNSCPLGWCCHPTNCPLLSPSPAFNLSQHQGLF